MSFEPDEAFLDPFNIRAHSYGGPRQELPKNQGGPGVVSAAFVDDSENLHACACKSAQLAYLATWVNGIFGVVPFVVRSRGLARGRLLAPLSVFRL